MVAAVKDLGGDGAGERGAGWVSAVARGERVALIASGDGTGMTSRAEAAKVVRCGGMVG